MILRFVWGKIAPLFSYMWGTIPNSLSAMSAPTNTRRHHGNGFFTKLTFVGLVSICFIALGALVACPTEEDDNESESSDASLNALTLSDGTLSPTFASNTTEYTASVADSVESVTVTATPTDTGASTAIMPIDADTATDGHQVSLPVGDTDITITVTAADNSTMEEYTITVTRSATASDTTAPTFTVVPADTATDVAVDASIVITADEPIRMTDGAEITNGTVAGLITLMETPSGSNTAADKPFTATINAAKRILTIDPTDDFALGASVSVSLARVEDAAGNDSEATALAATFTVVPTTIDISGRTQALQNAILATSQVTATDATAIPSPQLAAITSLTVSGVSSLMADDFANLSGLTTLNLGGNSGLTTLPSGILDDLLDTLTTLTLDTALQGTVEFATASGDIDQGTTIELSVTLTTALPTAVQIPYAVTFANSADAADFSGLADGMVTFAAGSTNAQSISVTATATAIVGGTATLTLGTPILTADTRTSDRLDSSSLVSVGSTASHTLTVVGDPGATLSVTDDSAIEEAPGGDDAVFTLALVNLPTSGDDDVSVFFTVSGFAGTIGGDDNFVTRLQTFATTTGGDVGVGPRDLDETTGAGRIELDQPDGSDDDIAVDGSSTAIFRIRLPMDDGNVVDETITLTINCVARSRMGTGRQGCIDASASPNPLNNPIVARSAVINNDAEITVTDDEDPMATLSVTDGSVTEEAADGTPGREAKIKLALIDMPTSGADDVSIFFTMSGFIPPIRSDSNAVTRFNAIASTTGFAENIMPTTNENTGAGLVAINRADGGIPADMDIDGDGSATVEFLLRLQKDDGNLDDETITLTINCVARSRSGQGEAGCTNAAGNILIAGSAVGGNGASIIGDDDVPFERLPEQDFTIPAAGHDFPRGLWSNGTTMWVANNGSGNGAVDKIFAYNLTSKARDSSKDFNTLAAGNTVPVGIWSDGTTMWVSDPVADKIFAYDLTNKERDSSKDFTTLAASNDSPFGLWSNDTTMWVADSAAEKIFAYNLTSKARDSSKDFNTLQAVGNTFPFGLWSNGTTMWVVDASATKIFAYNLTSKARDDSKNFNTLQAAGNIDPRGIWSNGTTMWVADTIDDRIYAYRMPPTE